MTLLEPELQAGSVDDELDRAFLRSTTPPQLHGTGGDDVGIVDLFSGCGGLTMGALEALHRAGRGGQLRLAVDSWAPALEVLADSLRVSLSRVAEFDLGQLLDDATRVTSAAELAHAVGGPCDLLLAGPPCQGHSALNNSSRHDDDRNDLYLAVAAAARTLKPRAVVIENVRGVSRDRRGAMLECQRVLEEELEYRVAAGPLDLHLLGAPQRRTRHIMVATTAEAAFDLDQLVEEQAALAQLRVARDVRWAIEDLDHRVARELADTASIPAADNVARLQHLRDNPDDPNLPDSQRPYCHHKGPHSYKSMYGRLSWDKPAQTITSGYGSMGQGRFVHPRATRMITSREAARLQMLPDYLELRHVQHRSSLATMIGNAAPPVLTLRIVGALLSQGHL